jgi:hypothetical protein
MRAQTNAVWSSTSAQCDIKVYADGGIIWPTFDASFDTHEVAEYEPIEWADDETEIAWQVVCNGRIDGTLRFDD